MDSYCVSTLLNEDAILYKNVEEMWPSRFTLDWSITSPHPIIIWGRQEGGSIDNIAQWKCGSLSQAADIIRDKLEIILTSSSTILTSVGVRTTMLFIIYFGAVG